MLKLIILGLVTTAAYSADISIIGPCNEAPVTKSEIAIEALKTSIGTATINFLEENKIPYIGSNEGFNSILNTPTGDDSIEVVSDKVLRAYGWCFSVNGKIPDKMPHEIIFESNNDKLVWFYAYSTYDSGKWIDYCVPSHKIKATQFCH